MTYLYKHWPFMGPFIALYVTLILFCNASHLSSFVFWIWLQFPIYLLHEFEEHGFPGGFKDFVDTHVFHSARPNTPLNDVRIFWINILGVWIYYPVFAVLAQLDDPLWGLYLVYFSLFNGFTHVMAFFIKKMYNPGLAVNVTLGIPAALYCLYLFHHEGLLSWHTTALPLGIAILGHVIIIAFARHWFRADQHKSAQQ